MASDNKKGGKMDILLNIINNRITSNILIYFVSIALIINAYILGGMISIKNRPDNSVFISDFNTSGTQENYATSTMSDNKLNENKIIFGSSKGKYFYYKGCEASNLSAKNIVYYKSEAEAIKLGKILHSSCE